MPTRKSLLAALVSLVLAAAVAVVFSPTAGAATANVYAALGDSYSSGEGVPPFISAPAGDNCHRSTRAYSQLLVGTAGFPAVGNFKACSGATVADFYNGMDGEASQLSQ